MGTEEKLQFWRKRKSLEASSLGLGNFPQLHSVFLGKATFTLPWPGLSLDKIQGLCSEGFVPGDKGSPSTSSPE